MPTASSARISAALMRVIFRKVVAPIRVIDESITKPLLASMEELSRRPPKR
jgi:hypothetical protein